MLYPEPTPSCFLLLSTLSKLLSACIGIEVVKCPRRGGDINILLLQREAFWIFTLDTLSPRGLNEDFDICPFL